MSKLPAVFNWLKARTDNVAVGLLTVIFLSFILQIVSRYIIRQPLGWTLELCLLSWLWLVFWSSAFTLTDRDHVRFSILYDSARPKIRAIYLTIAAICIVAAFTVSLAANYDFITFMKIEKTSLLKVRFDYVFSIYLIFSIAIIARYSWRVIELIRGRGEDTTK